LAYIVFRQNRIRSEGAGDIESTLRDRSLAFPEQVGQLAAIGNRHLIASVRQREMDGKIVAARQAAFLHQPYIPPDPKDDKALHTAFDLIRGTQKNSAYPPNPKATAPN
jgi:hypothetical protein